MHKFTTLIAACASLLCCPAFAEQPPLNLVSDEVGTLPEDVIDPVMVELLSSQELATMSAQTLEAVRDAKNATWSRERHDLLYRGHAATAELRAQRRRQLRAARDAALREEGLVVHEWGSLKHHLGTTTGAFDAVGEDQSDLPKFVEVWSKQPVLQPLMIEKPILYFYAPKEMKLDVEVRFPEGMLTQWYPAATSFEPKRINHGGMGLRGWGGGATQSNPMKNGKLKWEQLTLRPDIDPATFAKVDDDHPWWHTTRATDATPIQSATGVRERFLFYRGAGTFTPSARVDRDNPWVRIKAPDTQPLAGVFLVSNKNGKSLIDHHRTLDKGRAKSLTASVPARPVAASAAKAKAQMIEALEVAGLYPKEAAGLVKIWGDDFFAAEGDRVLYVIPTQRVNNMLPLNISPAPASSVRVLIAWIELSTEASEKEIRGLVQQLGADDFATREAAEKQLRELDRFAEAILRRVIEETKDEEVRARAERVLEGLEYKRSRGAAADPNNNELIVPAPNAGVPWLIGC